MPSVRTNRKRICLLLSSQSQNPLRIVRLNRLCSETGKIFVKSFYLVENSSIAFSAIESLLRTLQTRSLRSNSSRIVSEITLLSNSSNSSPQIVVFRRELIVRRQRYQIVAENFLNSFFSPKTHRNLASIRSHAFPIVDSKWILATYPRENAP